MNKVREVRNSKTLRDHAWLFTGIILLTAVLLKAGVDLDPSWDTWYYHIPFAGRLWGMTPPAMYEMEPYLETYYKSFPLFTEWLQGLLWWLTGHLQASNLVCAGSLIAYVIYLQKRFAVPFGFSALALLAIPVVQIHASSSYIDLPANLAVSVFLLLTWELYQRQEPFRMKELKPFFITALIAANSKFQMFPVVMLLIIGAGVRILWLNRNIPVPAAKLLRRASLLLIMLLLVFSVPVKNTMQFGNPLYPLTFEKRNGEIVFVEMGVPLVVIDRQFTHSWLMSVAEAYRPFGSWNMDQVLFPAGKGDRMGGYGVPYVLVQILVFLVFCYRQPRTVAIRNLQFFLFITVFTVWMPMSYMLRYYMYWMIVLVSMNLIWAQQMALRSLRTVMVASGVASLLLVAVMTRGFYLIPQFVSREELPRYVKRASPFDSVPAELDIALVRVAADKGMLCIQGQQPMTYLYASIFHPPVGYRVAARHGGEACPAR